MNVKADAKVIPYDFRSNFFLSNDQLHVIAQIHHTFADQATELASTLLHANVKISLVQTEQIPFSRFLSTQSKQCCYATMNLSSLPKQSILTINSELSYIIVERLLGGETDSPSYSHPFNHLELAILRQFINSFLQSLKTAWKPYLEIAAHIDEIGINPSNLHYLKKLSKCVVLTFRISILEVVGLISLAFPCESLYPIRNVLVSSERNHTEDLPIDPESIELELKAIIGSLRLSHDELINLKSGDILKLDQNLENPISLLLENHFLLNCYPGLIYKNKGVLLSPNKQHQK